MITAQEFVKAAEDFAVTRLFFEALVREGNVLAEDVASYEPNTPAHEISQHRYERIQSAAASAQTALGRYELALLRHVQNEYVDLIEAALDRLRIAGGTEAAKAIADQLESKYINESRIPEEAR
jgi:hypothetical protein